ncbi:substrate-binding domain-containing protein [Jannaschia sp. Os4]|nr:substrate-binding domain-containing protein [Jannaschia sp. Os4]MBM2576488.1 substrate-binding domain-containing protein [Jannaschia sp. Os4]
MTLREFAELVGLSPTTVSRALGGYPEVREETRRRVQKAAIDHGYRPNRRAAALATGRSMAIGHVIPQSIGHETVNPIFADFTAGAGEVYASAGYDMLMTTVPDDGTAAYERLAQSGAVDGFIVHGPRIDDARIGILQSLGLPFVVHGRASGAVRPYDHVDVENRRAFVRLTEHLIGLGHRRIGLVNGLEDMDFAHRRRDGFDAAMAAAGLQVDPAHRAAAEMTEPLGYAAAARMLDGPSPPTGLVVASVLAAVGVRRAIAARGLRIGADVSVAIFDDVLSYIGNEPDDREAPPFTATRSSVRAAGRRCAELLIARIAAPDRPIVAEVWDCPLVLGRSTGPAPA